MAFYGECLHEQATAAAQQAALDDGFATALAAARFEDALALRLAGAVARAYTVLSRRAP